MHFIRLTTPSTNNMCLNTSKDFLYDNYLNNHALSAAQVERTTEGSEPQ
jgi:hypothetical protein